MQVVTLSTICPRHPSARRQLHLFGRQLADPCRSHPTLPQRLIHARVATYQMATSTYALPVKTAIAPGPKRHERRRSSMQSPTTSARSPSGSSSGNGGPGTAHSVNHQHEEVHGQQHARRISSSNNVLGIEGVKSWESRAVAVGPVPVAIKGRRHRGQSEMGRRFPLQTTFLNSPRSPRTPLSAK